MPATPLTASPRQRIWGRRALPPAFGQFAGAEPVGEVWFENTPPDQLLVKFLFTSKALSIQVHPDDSAAKRAGHPRGKDEAWLVVDAEPGAVIALGPKRSVDRDELRRAALDGTIEGLLDWRPVESGAFFYLPAGTIHALGGGLTLIEIQQNVDLTYRLYDYGRPRQLHVEEAVSAACRHPFVEPWGGVELGLGRHVLAAGGAFTVERWQVEQDLEILGSELLLVPLAAAGSLDGEPLEPGMVWRVEGPCRIEGAPGFDVLAAYLGPTSERLFGHG